MIPVLTSAQANQWDAAAAADGRPLRMLMETAGRAVARVALEAGALSRDTGTVVVTGGGNNGGDGWVAARALHMMGIPVRVAECAEPPGGDAADARRLALSDGVETVRPDGEWPDVPLVIDAMLGTGGRGAPRGAIAAAVSRIAAQGTPVIAVDGPTGLDLDLGIDHGALPAITCVTFGGLRRGHLLARDVVGRLVVADIGHPRPEANWPRFFDPSNAWELMPHFASAAHKGDRGRVVVIGGAPGMTGAARMAARSAFAAGAGLVHAVVPDEATSDIALAEPDVQVSGHRFAAPINERLCDLLESADAVLIGPGLGRGAESAEFVIAVMGRSSRLVIDADALTVLAGRREELRELAASRQVVLTPHRGEFRSLFGEFSDAAATDPWGAASQAAVSSGCTVLLKGVPTVIAAGADDLLTVASGNPGLATGGSGDLLGGLIATFLAQGVDPDLAAALGAQALGDGATQAALEHGARGMRPMHVVGSLHGVWHGWQQLHSGPRDWLVEMLAPAEI